MAIERTALSYHSDDRSFSPAINRRFRFPAELAIKEGGFLPCIFIAHLQKLENSSAPQSSAGEAGILGLIILWSDVLRGRTKYD